MPVVITFQTVLPFLGAATRCRVLRKSCHPFTREARHLPRSIASAARFVLDLWIGVTAEQPTLLRGRSGIFTGQCEQPFCPGDPTKHSDGPRLVPKFRGRRRRIGPSGLHQVTELGPPSEPNRDTSRTIFTWPLRRRSLLPDAGCVPRQSRVRVKISERAWTRPGRIRFHQLSFLIKSHRLRLSHSHLRLTRNPTRKRGSDVTAGSTGRELRTILAYASGYDGGVVRNAGWTNSSSP